MKNLKKIIFTMIFVSVISLIGILKVNASCMYGDLPNALTWHTGSYYCVGGNYGNFRITNMNINNIQTIVSATGGGWERTISKILINPNVDDTSFIFTGGKPACNFVPGGYNCNNNASSYDFSTYPVNSEGVAYYSEPISVELGLGYYGNLSDSSRMTNYVFESALDEFYDSGNHVFEFYFAIGYITDSDWQDYSKVTNAFNFNSSTLKNFYLSQDVRSWTNSNSTGNTGFSPTFIENPDSQYGRFSPTINSISVEWFGFPSATMPYYILGTDTDYLTTTGNYYVAKISIDFSAPHSFTYFAFEYDGSGTSYWADAKSFYENLLFANGSIHDNKWLNYVSKNVLFTSASGYSQMYSGLPLTGSLAISANCSGSDGSIVDFSEINGGIYYYNSSSGSIFSQNNFQLLPFKYAYATDTNGKKVLTSYYVDYDFSYYSQYDSLLFISSGKADRILSGYDSNERDYYCSQRTGIWNKSCKLLSKLPLLNGIINNLSSKEYKKSFPTDYLCVFEVPDSNFYNSSLIYNSSTDSYFASFKNSNGEISSISSSGVISSSPNLTDVFGSKSSFISPTLGVIHSDLLAFTNDLTTGDDSEPFVLLFSFFCIIFTLLILKAGVKH